MDLSYGGEYEAFREKVQKFIKRNRHLAPKGGRGRNRDGVLEWQKLLIENGYAGRTIPTQYGGYGAEPDPLITYIINEEFARGQVPGAMGGQGIAYMIPTLLEMGTEDQRVRFIPPTLTGEMIWCEGYSEPDAGSDLASLRTNAILDGDEWVVNGRKIWTSTAKQADWIFCLVRSEPDKPKHHGISFLLFSMDSPGIEVRPLVQMTGDDQFNEVFFSDVRLPKDQIVGKPGQGWHVANKLLLHERVDLGDPNISLTRLNMLTELMKQETASGERAIDNPVFRDRLMRIQGRVMALRFNDLRLLSSRVNNEEAALATMIVKLQGTELRHDLEGLAIDALGNAGLLYEDDLDKLDRTSWQFNYMLYLGLIIGGGTSQIQKNIIGERCLGLPREPKPPVQ